MEMRDKDVVRMKQFSQNLRDQRLEKGFSQKDLAFKSGASPSYIKKLERKEPAPNPCITILFHLAYGLNVEPKVLLPKPDWELRAPSDSQTELADGPMEPSDSQIE